MVVGKIGELRNEGLVCLGELFVGQLHCWACREEVLARAFPCVAQGQAP